MNKIVKSLVCLGLCGSLAFAFGCNKTDGDMTETRPLKLSTGALDKNFNPFFYTAQNDGNMIANTQIGMLTTDENGNIVAGQNQPTVVLDYKETKYTTKDVGTGTIVSSGDDVGRTEYEFVIKNGIKFSDGKELSIVDVLFNLYVYLDPAYTGSTTIYSTDIQGLKSYRAQDPSLPDNSTADTDARFRGEAEERINVLIDWSLKTQGYIDVEKDPNASKDLATVKEMFGEELESMWNATVSGWKESYEKTNRFTDGWQVFFYQLGIVEDQYTTNANHSSSRITDEDGKFYTTLDPWQTGNNAGGKVGDIALAQTIEQMEAANGDEAQKAEAIKIAKNYFTGQTDLWQVLSYFDTAYNVLEQFTNEQRSKHFDSLSGTGVKSIKGISTYTAKGSALTNSFHGEMNETYVAGEDYSVLKIVINGVDPKAIYNFAFTVAPLHYYSGTFEGVDYIKEAKEKYNAANGDYCFGVKVGNTEFFKTVLQDPDKVGIPVGAGAYMASDSDGNVTKDKNAFAGPSSVNFVRNPYFETVGTGINNAKIKLIRYQVLADDQIMSSLTTQSIDFGSPNATPTNMLTVTQNNFLAEKHYTTGGYGYIGINPKFVPEYKVRQAIMKAMDTNATLAYYGEELAQTLYRPLTKTSWVYNSFDNNSSINKEYPSIAYFRQDTDPITKLVEDAGYTKVNGVYTKTRNVEGMANNQIGKKLKLSFVIAGSATDHPAYNMLNDACDILNDLGFDITVKTDASALQKLATGNLEVWAAAWSSSIDPDPYQVYHKDSTATSVLNWNYRNILNDPTKWSYEYDIIQKLSDRIDDGRNTTDREQRAQIYGGAEDADGNKACFDLIMDLAVELPTYQRCDLCVYNKNVIDANSLVKNPSYNMGLFDKLWEIDYVK